jgi:GMP synthase-like glutamine amidotransferase
MPKHKRKIYVVGSSDHYANWMQGQVVNSIQESDLVLFTGGEDVHPVLYGETAHHATWPNLMRDKYEIRYYEVAKREGKPMIGICRGAQFLCVMAGGSLVQHMHHPGVHEVDTKDGRKIEVTSLHHQRQYPWGRKGANVEVIAWSDHLSPFSHGASPSIDLSDKPEVEIARYPTIKALAIQSHPEMCYPTMADWEKKYLHFCRELLDDHMTK